MNGFRPQIATADRPARRFSPALIAMIVVALIAIGWLLVRTPDSGIDAPSPADTSAAPSARSPVSGSATRPADLPPPEPYKPDPAGRAMLDGLQLAPKPVVSGTLGYVVTKADAELLAGTPLREGDVLLELDGQKLDPARVERLGDELGEYDDVWVTFERDGEKIGTVLELRRR